MLGKLFNRAPMAAPVDRTHEVASLEARLHAQTRELGRLRAEDALKQTIITDLRAKLDRFTAPRERDSRGRYQPVSAKTAEVAHVG